ncbi:MAG: hypothetical protein RIA64_01545 [Rhodospirillales bacterium]
MTNISDDGKGKAPPVSFLDNPHAPEVFADEAAGFFLHHGNVHITFASARVDHSTRPGPVNRVVMARMVMPVPAAQSMVNMLYDFLKEMGVDPAAPPKGVNLQ